MTNEYRRTRRRFVAASGAAGIGLIAGCLGDSETDDEPRSQPDDSFPEFDPTDPEWPQPARRLIDEEFDKASIEELTENFDERTEPRYGRAPRDPADPEETIDPDPLVFAWTPGEEPQVYDLALVPLKENIEAETGRDVELLTVDSYAAMTEALRSERLHISRIGAGNLPFAVNMTGAYPFAMPYGDGTFGNRLWILTHMDERDINTVDDLVGREVTHTERTSGSGHLEPSVFLENEEGIVPGEDYDVTFSGGHFQSCRGIYMGDYEVGPLAGPIPGIMDDDGEVDADDLKVVWAGAFARPLGPMCYLHNLPTDVKEGIERAHFDYDYEGTALDTEARFDDFEPIDYATHYDPVLQVHEAQEMEYTEDNL